MEKFSFKKGFDQVQRKDVNEVKRKIMKALNISTRSAWRARLSGEVEPRVSEAESLERIFAEYGITDFWGV